MENHHLTLLEMPMSKAGAQTFSVKSHFCVLDFEGHIPSVITAQL